MAGPRVEGVNGSCFLAPLTGELFTFSSPLRSKSRYQAVLVGLHVPRRMPVKARAVSVFRPDYAISRVYHRLEGMAFAFSENRTKVTLLDPAQVENAIVTRRVRFFAAVIDGKGR